MDISRATVFVTGATSGIGLAIAELLSKKGFYVFGGALPGEKVEALKKTGASLVSLDVTDQVSVEVARTDIAKNWKTSPYGG